MEFQNTQHLVDFMLNFDKLFDIVRVVDPIRKQIVEYDQKGLDCRRASCFEYWKTGTHCRNCVSARAMNEKDTFVKIEYNKEKIFMVMASPAKLPHQRYIVEMMKDITGTGIVPDLNGKTDKEIDDIIAMLNKEVVTDDLTQLFNRRYLNERLPAEIYYAIQNHRSLSVIMIDMDYFKNINDTYGHAAGDSVLRNLCACIESNIRAGYDWAARLGGEEFLVVMPGAGKAVCTMIAEKMRTDFENSVIEHKAEKIKATFSAGVYTMNGEEVNMNELLDYADQNLYKAKKTGRNRVVGG